MSAASVSKKQQPIYPTMSDVETAFEKLPPNMKETVGRNIRELNKIPMPPQDLAEKSLATIRDALAMIPKPVQVTPPASIAMMSASAVAQIPAASKPVHRLPMNSMAANVSVEKAQAAFLSLSSPEKQYISNKLRGLSGTAWANGFNQMMLHKAQTTVASPGYAAMAAKAKPSEEETRSEQQLKDMFADLSRIVEKLLEKEPQSAEILKGSPVRIVNALRPLSKLYREYALSKIQILDTSPLEWEMKAFSIVTEYVDKESNEAKRKSP